MILSRRGLAGRKPGFGRGADRRDFYALRGKRALDIAGALVLLVVFSPLMLVIALLMLPQRGPAFFGHNRVGQGGAEFACLKYRTMVPDAEARLQELLARHPDARRQWQGRITSWTTIHASPALAISCAARALMSCRSCSMCCAANNMSLVGPRPVTRAELQRYGEDGAG